MSDFSIARPFLGGRIARSILRWPRLGKRPVPLDIKSLPDHLKRDMGILDGNDPAGRRK